MQSELLLPSLRKGKIDFTTTTGNDFVPPNIQISKDDEKAYTKTLADYDLKSQEVLDVIKDPIEKDLVEQAFNPANITNYITNDAYYDNVIKEIAKNMKDDVQGASKIDTRNKKTENERIDQLKTLLLNYDDAGKIQKLNYYLDNDAGLKRKLKKEDLDLIISKERFQYWAPDKMAQKIIDESKALDPDDETLLEKIKENMERDRIARERDYLTEDALLKRVGEYTQLLINGPLKGNVNQFKEYEKDFKRKLYIDLNILNDQIKRIEAQISTNPGSKVSMVLSKIVDNTINDLRDGKIDLNIAFDKINGANKMLKPTAAETLSQMVNTKYKNEIQQKMIPKMDRETYINELKTKNIDPISEISFNDKKYSGIRLITGVGYEIEPKTKEIIKDNIEKVTNNVYKISGQDFQLGEDYIGKKGYTKAVLGNAAQAVYNDLKTRGIELNLKDFKTINEVVSGKKITKTKEEIMDEIKTVYNKLTELTDFIDKTAKMTPAVNNYQILEKYMLPEVGEKVPKVKTKSAIELRQRQVEMKPTSTFFDAGGTPAEQRENKAKREKKYSTENLLYHKEFTKENKDESTAQYGPNIFEYNVKNEDQLLKMKQTVSKMEGQLFIIDLKTGRLFPIELDKTFPGQTYIFMKQHETGGSFAEIPVQQKIYRDEEKLMPYKHLQYGRDKRQFRTHQVPRNEYTIDYRDQIRNEIGAGFWKSLKNGVKHAFYAPIDAAADIGKYVANKTVHAAKDLAKQSVYEGKNFITQEKRNLNTISSANKKFFKHPSLKNFANAYNETSSGLGKLVAQPLLTGTRELANVSDFAGNVPGLNLVKYGAQYTIPGLAVADALAHATKNLNMGTDEKPKYLDAAINTLDAITGTGQLSGSAQIGARVLSGGLQIADKIIDDH